MGNTLRFKGMICCESARDKAELYRALKKAIDLAKIAIRTGRIISIELKEMEDPMLKEKDKVALGLSGLCSGQ